MKSVLILGLILFTITVQAKVFERCELARILKENGMDGYNEIPLASWVCLVQYESNYNTSATKYNVGNTSRNYGIFQINSRFWCNDMKTSQALNICKIPCSAVMQDDITEAIKCAKKVARNLKAIPAWMAWKANCENQDLSQYTQNCGV